MAIGSEAEIGVEFSRWGEMNNASRQAWFNFMQTNWGPDLMGNYGTLGYPKRPFVDLDPFPEGPYVEE